MLRQMNPEQPSCEASGNALQAFRRYRIVPVAALALTFVAGCTGKSSHPGKQPVAESVSNRPTPDETPSTVATAPTESASPAYVANFGDNLWPCNLIPLAMRTKYGTHTEHVKGHETTQYQPGDDYYCPTVNQENGFSLYIQLGGGETTENYQPVSVPGLPEGHTYERTIPVNNGGTRGYVVNLLVQTPNDATDYFGGAGCTCSAEDAKQYSEELAQQVFPLELSQHGAPPAGAVLVQPIG